MIPMQGWDVLSERTCEGLLHSWEIWEESVQSGCWCFSPCVRVSYGCFQRTIGRLIKLSNHITPSPAITIRCGAEVDYAQALPKPSAAGWHRPWYPCKAGTCCPKEHKRGVLCSWEIWEESVQSICWCFSPCVRVSCGLFQRTIGRPRKLLNHNTPSPAISIWLCIGTAQAQHSWVTPPMIPMQGWDVLSERTCEGLLHSWEIWEESVQSGCWCFSPCVRVSYGCFQRTIGRLIKLSNHITPSPAITIRCGAEVDYAQALPKPSAAGWHRPWYPCKAGMCCPKEHVKGFSVLEKFEKNLFNLVAGVFPHVSGSHMAVFKGR